MPYEIIKYITEEGLSRGARVTLAVVVLLMAALTLAVETEPFSREGLTSGMIAGYCVLIAAACLLTGRRRRFVGSLIALSIVVMSLWYVMETYQSGDIVAAGRAEPSLVNAIILFAVAGIPCMAYLLRARFGLMKNESSRPLGPIEEDVYGQ